MKPFRLAICLALAVIAATGCSTAAPRVEPFNVGPVPPEGERLIINQIVILTDSSGSMASARDMSKFPTEKSLLESFVSGMPDLNYGAGLVGFGDHSWVELPLMQFERGAMADAAARLPFIGSLTPLGDGINRANAQMRGTSGRTAILVFSDGRPTSEIAAFSAANGLVAKYQDVCFHTVLIGDDPDGAEFMRSLAELTPCGSYQTEADISTEAGMRDLIRRIFYGPCPDQDGDGVCDDRDQCPDTPRGVAVDANGCPPVVTPPVEPPKGPCPDQDGDGVCDDQDQCPDTPKGARVDERGCWVIGEVLFDYDKAFIRPEYQGLLDDVANVIQQNPDISVRIDGHTDSIASNQYNQRLSERRAQSVFDYLARKGVDTGRLSTQGFGETQPVDTNATEEGRQRNRRTEFTVVGGR